MFEIAPTLGQSLPWKLVCLSVCVSVLQAKHIHGCRMAPLWLMAVRMLCVCFVVFPSSSAVSCVCERERHTHTSKLICKMWQLSVLCVFRLDFHSLLFVCSSFVMVV